MSKLIIAEKPSVAKSIASALGASSRADGFYEGSGLIVSWCVGHLVSPLDAGGYDERFKKWRYEDLPILPKPFRYAPIPGKEAALDNVKRLMTREDVHMGERNVADQVRDLLRGVPAPKPQVDADSGDGIDHLFYACRGIHNDITS